MWGVSQGVDLSVLQIIKTHTHTFLHCSQRDLRKNTSNCHFKPSKTPQIHFYGQQWSSSRAPCPSSLHTNLSALVPSPPWHALSIFQLLQQHKGPTRTGFPLGIRSLTPAPLVARGRHTYLGFAGRPSSHNGSKSAITVPKQPWGLYLRGLKFE